MRITFFFSRRKALQIWTEKSGDKATYKNLEKVFEKAGYCNLACKVKKLADELSTSKSLNAMYYIKRGREAQYRQQGIMFACFTAQAHVQY